MNTERIPVLMYHRIGDTHNDRERKYCVSPENFATHIHALDARGYKACSITEFFDWLKGDIRLPDKSLLITFDDGFLGVFEHGLPVLKEHNWPAVMFLVSRLIGKQDIWHHNQHPSAQTYPLVGLQEIDTLRANGFSFFSHSRSHADLSQLGGQELQDELRGSREDLESLLQEPVPYFAYPYGRYNERVLYKLKAAGYRAAFSVQPGFNHPGIDPFHIRRIDVFGTDSAAQLLRKTTFGTNDGSWQQALRYYSTRLFANTGIKPR